jgi:hypothetical protein
MNIYVYIHVCCINNWKSIFLKLYSNIKNSGLIDIIKGIKCNILSTNNDDVLFFKDLDKVEIIGLYNDLNLYETPTINLLHEHALIEDFYVLYIHTKGVKYNDTSENIKDWVNFLTYFNIQKHTECINYLLEYDAVGVNLYSNPPIYPTHYSGNFWWSKSDYIRKLDKCIYSNYNSPEFWLTETEIGNYLSLLNSNVNHYHERYQEEKYINK